MKEKSNSGGLENIMIGEEKLYWNSWQDAEVDATAKMLIHLLENKIITL